MACDESEGQTLEIAPGGKHFRLHRARFIGIFAPGGILKYLTGAIFRQKYARWRPFPGSTGRGIKISPASLFVK